MKVFVTYGWGYDQGGHFSVVEGEDYADCRRKIDEVTNGQFAFAYTEEEFEGQAERYGYTEIPLQPQTREE
jgi:hypothetical protein